MAKLKAYLRAEYETDLTNLQESIKTGTISFESSMTGDDYVNGQTQEIGTIEEALDLPGSVGSNPFVIIKNLSADNFVEVGLTGSYAMRIDPGEFIAFRANGSLFAKADTAACIIEMRAFED